MRRRSLVSRVALWAAVCALVLRAGMPWLATTAAQMRGVPVSEVCEVYGVSLPAMPSQEISGHRHHHVAHSHHGSHSGADHGCDHCALTALGALATPCDTPQQAANQIRTALTEVEIEIRCQFHDACAAWAARLEHGPPTRT